MTQMVVTAVIKCVLAWHWSNFNFAALQGFLLTAAVQVLPQFRLQNLCFCGGKKRIPGYYYVSSEE